MFIFIINNLFGMQNEDTES